MPRLMYEEYDEYSEIYLLCKARFEPQTIVVKVLFHRIAEGWNGNNNPRRGEYR
jgi:hypothetical protein